MRRLPLIQADIYLGINSLERTLGELEHDVMFKESVSLLLYRSEEKMNDLHLLVKEYQKVFEVFQNEEGGG